MAIEDTTFVEKVTPIVHGCEGRFKDTKTETSITPDDRNTGCPVVSMASHLRELPGSTQFLLESASRMERWTKVYLVNVFVSGRLRDARGYLYGKGLDVLSFNSQWSPPKARLGSLTASNRFVGLPQVGVRRVLMGYQVSF
jgi:hypothetical protein